MIMMRSGLSVVLAFALTTAAHGAPVDWSQFNFDPQHSGNNVSETIITRDNVGTLHPLYQVTLPDVADGAPVWLQSVTTPSGTKDLLFLTTKGGHLVALDAQSGATVWSKRPATGPRYTTSSPAIDPNRQYVYGYGLDGKVHKYQVGDGTEIVTGGWPQVATLKPDVEKGSSALAIATAANGSSYLYVASSGYPGDAGDYQGHVTAIDLASGAQVVFNTNCSNQSGHFVELSPPDCAHVQSAVWARPGVVYDALGDRIFFATGNGDYDAHFGGFDWGDSVIALSPTGASTAGMPLDSYTPAEFQQLQSADKDLGSTAPAIFPPVLASRMPHLAIQSGKDAQIRLLNRDDLSGAGGPARVGGALQQLNVPQGGAVLTQPAVWGDPTDGALWVFIANDHGISGLQLVVDGAGNPSLSPRWSNPSPGTSPIVANGILYVAGPRRLSALDPTSGVPLWSDTSIGPIHWESPIVINGTLFATDENALLWAYGPTIFADVPAADPFEPWIDALVRAGITDGCGTNPARYCPSDSVTRAQMAVFLLRGMAYPGSANPAPATGTVFADVPVSYPLANWVEALYAAGITGGCAPNPLRFCPDDDVTRGTAAVFLLRAKHGAGYDPPVPTQQTFADVPLSHPFAKWIYQLAAEGITAGCATSPAQYCPDASVTRAQMAVFLVRAFSLPM
jgi:outer membrane protein assembly factor BamB